MNLFTKQKWDTDVKTNLQFTKGGKWEGINWEIGTDIDTLVYIK